MPFDIRSDAFTAAIPADSKLEEIAGNFGFTEGPIWHPSEHWLMFSDIQESHQYKWSEGEGLRVFRTPSNQANGNFFDRAGRVISCEHAASQLVRHEHDGKLVVPLATHYAGKELNSPNDVICDSKGRIWFTDPSFGRIREDLGILRDQELPYQGVFRLDPDGTLALVADDFQQPNGLCLSADESRLFVNDSWGGHIRVMDVAEDGRLTDARVWADVTGEGEGVPDGMKTTTEGHILCNGPGGVHLFDADATCLGVILTLQKSTNFCFGGPAFRTLFITASTSVYRIETALTGLAMF
ncbi:MAG: SMP-30/gluconolactonase/LRE family protein [Marinovum algicola]|uniref:Gluconolactonase n=1 Tax=Marinovum algicola TaxID=42444 RepID=A0A975WCN9_9RHOB|nr:SMP-30/gluconolactonase/LRE family protein [Marinovum algicola]SEJ93020.1 gluconolactonase [Marinovum algicola]SLN66262.1 Gluconolactonase precursor [Marinovum algicola]